MNALADQMQCWDVGADMIVGDREIQEDSLAYAVSDDGKTTIIVLADGMGGHECGEVASNIVVGTMVNQLGEAIFDRDLPSDEIQTELRRACEKANVRLSRYQELHPETVGMGTTLVALVLHQDEAHWISIGDSPLLMHSSDGKLVRLNADHSMAAMLDKLAEAGKIEKSDALADPRRSQLTSAMTGQPIARLDLNKCPVPQNKRCLFVVASDGLLSRGDDEISKILDEAVDLQSSEVAKTLTESVVAAKAQDQDNTSIAVARVTG